MFDKIRISGQGVRFLIFADTDVETDGLCWVCVEHGW